MEATKADPYRMPAGLSRAEQQWWTAMRVEIREHKHRAQELSRSADLDQRAAQRARDDYARLRNEYRLRHGATKPQWAIDILFKGLAVAQECITDDGWYSRQATEKYTAATFHYTRASELSEELIGFLKRRTAETLAARPVPRPREAS